MTDKYQYIRDQAPSDVTDADIEAALALNNGNALDAIAHLWSIPKPPVKEPKTKIDELREMCDCFDSEAEKYLKTLADTNNSRIAGKNGSESKHT